MNYGDYIKEVAQRANLSQAETKRIYSTASKPRFRRKVKAGFYIS